MIRPYNMATRAAPFDSLRIDDLGDIATNAFNKDDSVARIEAYVDALMEHDLVTVAMGVTTRSFSRSCEHWRRSTARSAWCTLTPTPTSTTTCSARRSPTAHRSAGRSKKASSTVIVSFRSVFRTGYAADDFDWSREQGFRVVQVEECWHRARALDGGSA